MSQPLKFNFNSLKDACYFSYPGNLNLKQIYYNNKNFFEKEKTSKCTLRNYIYDQHTLQFKNELIKKMKSIVEMSSLRFT